MPAASSASCRGPCRSFRAKTKGKVERMIREPKESFAAWLSGQVLPIVALPASVVDLQLRRLGEHVDVRDLA